MRVTLDPAVLPFLDDHRVGGVPLLPTVMAVDLMVRATGLGAVATDPDADAPPLTLTDVTVGPPVLLPGGRPRTVEVVARRDVGGPAGPTGGSGFHSEVVGDAGGGAGGAGGAGGPAHYSATIVNGGGKVGPGRLPTPGCLTPLEIYPPYFHGPLVQVIASAARGPDGLRAGLRPGLPMLAWSDAPVVSSPTLLELFMQTCGLWDLLESGRMMIPHALDSVELLGRESRLPAAGVRATASVRPRDDARGPGPAFDGEVVDAAGRVLVRVRGYRTVDLGQRVAGDTVERIRVALATAGGTAT